MVFYEGNGKISYDLQDVSDSVLCARQFLHIIP
jgi:hypothetical protein